MSIFFNILILYILILLLIIYIAVDLLKNIYKFEILLENIFRGFLKIEKISLDFSKDFYNFLCNEVRKIFFAKIAAFFIINGNTIKFESLTSSNPDILIQQKKVPGSVFEINSELTKTKEGRKKYFKDIFQNVFINKFQFLTIPIHENSKIDSVFMILFEKQIPYFRAKKRIIFNSRKLKEILYDINTVLKERRQDVSMVMLGSIKDYAFISVDTNFFIASWNKGAEIMFGYSSGEVVNKKITDFIDEKSLDKFYRSVKISEKTEEVKLEIVIKDCNSTMITTDGVIKRILIEDTFSGFYIVIKDITKEEVWKNNIKKQSMINKSIVENARDGILLLNEEDRIVYLNEKVKKIIGTEINYLGIQVNQIFSREYGPKILEKINELKNSRMELNFLNIKISEFWYNIRLFPIRDNENIQGIIIFFIDNTYIMKTREKLENMNKNLIDNLQVAKGMHLGLVPAALPNNNRIHFQNIFIPTDEIGGDFYYVDEIDFHKIKNYLAILADVSGHGIGASMLTVLVKDVYSDFKNLFEHEEDVELSRFLKMLNKKIINLNMEGSKFVTIFLILLDIEKRKIKYSSAGHPHSIIISKKGKLETFGMDKSPPIGIFDDFNYTEESKDILPGDKIFIYSDGILDIFSSEQELFNKFLLENKNLDIKNLKTILEKKIQKAKSSDAEKDKWQKIDDITIILSEFIG